MDVEMLVVVGSGDLVEDQSCGRVSVGSVVGGLDVELPAGLSRGATAADEDADGLVDV
jgi:hypothetical protein